ncbi:MAG: cytochrome c peroxidase [Gammaproteobacteria bacterium]|nr:cytochrome c peroxidase [Gammaproteobacteria bacterium]
MSFRPVLLLALLLVAPVYAVEFDQRERATIASHGPWPPPPVLDDSNRVSGNKAAIRFGEMLFFDHALGGDSRMSCASCHDPGRAFTDGRTTGFGRTRLARNTTSLLNLAGNRWFGWGGENDSLWAQSIRPILALEEMASTPLLVKKIVLGRDRYREYYRDAFSVAAADEDSEILLVNVGKALAAYQETLVSPRSPFDDFRDALLAGDEAAMAQYPRSAQRGLKLFIGEGRCSVCHLGPRFSNGEFENVGIPFQVPGGVDPGRYQGIQKLLANPYNRLGPFNDGNAQDNAVATRSLRPDDRNRGRFRVPGLRDLVETAPYMHDGSLGTLDDVVRHYSELDDELAGAGADRFLRPLRLDDRQVEDLTAFLRSLSAY